MQSRTWGEGRGSKEDRKLCCAHGEPCRSPRTPAVPRAGTDEAPQWRCPLVHPLPQSPGRSGGKPGCSLEGEGGERRSRGSPSSPQGVTKPPVVAELRVRAAPREERPQSLLHEPHRRVGGCGGNPMRRCFDFSDVSLITF